MALQHRRHLLHDLQVEAEQLLQTGALHLQHHLPTAAQTGAVHLGQGRRPQRFRIEIDHLGTALTELVLKGRLHPLKGKRRHAVLQGRQLLNPSSGKDVRAR